jgi:predicted aldo/keto reductase-like oxidoreductase
MPCPNGVYIRGIFNFYNEASLFNKQEDALCFYKRMKTARADGSACIKCGRCEMLCPQHLPIMNLLEEVDREWSKQLKMTNPD